ncbi:ABC transporter substrate-binding protein [Kaistia dalseonensis]|uniref:Sulfonate transport system substrate-binding protein n=1 Tax=Kaistia dalseonensis TaxID=410840 RepID=A0ABU0H1R8_9HYPH|nr:ABC transporter substrate-binding protein [Kaistia dalseonensis]MCX5493687.1 ABC transporter substrate-binding protein [Kaistia dalseonensis]MDQ0436250.1 sulfonate transport system substrate-binding protein [Kaistia dalseonensis]
MTHGRFGQIAKRLGLGLAATAMLATAALADDAPDLSKLTITVGTPNKTGLHRQLIASGEADNVPYTIKWADFDSTPPLVEALRAGHVDIAAGGDTGVLFGIANGLKITILAGTWERKESGSAILVRGDSPLQTVEELKGHKVALPYFTKQHYQFAKALEQANVPFDEKLILRLNTTDGLSALVNGQVDAFVVWDPNTAIAQQQHGARILKSLSKVIDTAGVLYTPTADLDDPARKAALQDLTRRIIRAQAWVNAHPDEWSAQVAKLSQISPDAAALQTSRSRVEYVPATDADVIAGWQQEVDYFHKTGSFKTAYDVKDYVAKDFGDVITDENKKLAASQ